MAKILLVEDNEMNRDLIARKLRRKGYEVALAFDGAEGIEAANNETPDLILMDMGLPILDGYAATRLLKSNDETRAIPVIGLSAHAMTGDAEKAKEAGCDDYDTKPVEWDRLFGKIEKLLAKTQSTVKVSSEDMETTMLEAPASASHLLVVDDSPMHREVLSRRLVELGYTYDLAESADEARQYLAARPFDAILLDVTLPNGASGVLLQDLRKREGDPVPVILLCPIDATDQAVRSLALGADDFVQQPFKGEILKTRIWNSLERHRLKVQEETYAQVVAGEERHSEHLLRVLFPDPVVEELKTTQKILPRRHPDVALIFSDVVGFKHECDTGEPVQVISQLQDLVSAYEDVLPRYGLLKVKTVGDTIVGASGLFRSSSNPVLDCVRCAFEMREAAKSRHPGWKIRVGIDVGPVVAGVVGRRRYQFDVWGSAVQNAALVKSHGAVDAVNLSATAWKRLDGSCAGESLGNFPVGDGEALTIYRADRLITV